MLTDISTYTFGIGDNIKHDINCIDEAEKCENCCEKELALAKIKLQEALMWIEKADKKELF